MIIIPNQENPLELQGEITLERQVDSSSIRFRGYRGTIGAYSYGTYDSIIHNSDIGRFTSIAHRAMIGPIEQPFDSNRSPSIRLLAEESIASPSRLPFPKLSWPLFTIQLFRMRLLHDECSR